MIPCKGHFIFYAGKLNQERSEPPLKNGNSHTVASMLTRSWRIVSGAPIG